MQVQEAARKAIEETPPLIKETPVIVQDTEKIDLLTAEVEGLKVDSLSLILEHHELKCVIKLEGGRRRNGGRMDSGETER